MKLTEVESLPDGTFEVEVLGLDRIELEHLDTSGTYPVGRVTPLAEQDVAVPDDVADAARATFEAYREALVRIDREPPSSHLPRDPAYLSWTLAALAPLSLAERQALLEAEDADSRLTMVTDVLRTELRTMQVIPSLPATEIARTRWSPN